METKGLGAGSYPEPKEEKERKVSATIYVKYTLDIDLPEKWSVEEIKRYITDEFHYFNLCDEEIQEIEVQ